ncbi:DUF3748 domain-containing protein [Proteus columbae]|uniref:DUF3748 domain-containing protein n=1 Tax=Proteus columbae TaxID=1987580 RepID=UPI00288B0E45|nr:DUF3748 domain-containing protein [Proteus columbae]
MSFQEHQITFDSRHHQLTNINVWTPDSQWLVYDVRPNGGSFTGLTIEKIHAKTKQQQIIYTATQGAHAGVATVSPTEPIRYAFIHGPENPDNEWHYDFHHRRGVIVDESENNRAFNIDACSLTSPYQAGALRGGTHVHVFSPDGTRLSFTYNDHIMHELGGEYDQRNVAVAVPLKAVNVTKKHPREYDGEYFCTVISQTVAHPQKGSDEINKAYEECWVGIQGYTKADGSQQRWAIAFIGDTVSENGDKVSDIFLVDLPDDNHAFSIEGDKPLAGTDTTMPARAKGIEQIRLTNTANRKYAGVLNQPRHWLRSSPQGDAIAFLMKDDNGVVQLYTVSPSTKEVKQITSQPWDIQSAFTWNSNGQYLTFICDNSVMLCNAKTGELTRLTEKTAQAPSSDAVVFSPNDQYIAFMRDVDGYRQIFTVETGL